MQDDASKATHPKISGKRANDRLYGYLIELIPNADNLDHDTKNTGHSIKKYKKE
jgi:hypothetical protein